MAPRTGLEPVTRWLTAAWSRAHQASPVARARAAALPLSPTPHVTRQMPTRCPELRAPAANSRYQDGHYLGIDVPPTARQPTENRISTYSCNTIGGAVRFPSSPPDRSTHPPRWVDCVLAVFTTCQGNLRKAATRSWPGRAAANLRCVEPNNRALAPPSSPPDRSTHPPRWVDCVLATCAPRK